jgi:hypothetical protein
MQSFSRHLFFLTSKETGAAANAERSFEISLCISMMHQLAMSNLEKSQLDG